MDESRQLRKAAAKFSDRSRKVLVSSSKAYVPLKFNEDGHVLSPSTFDVRKHLKALSLKEIEFLDLWASNDFDEVKTAPKSVLSDEQCKRLFKKLDPFKQEHTWLTHKAKLAALKASPEYLIDKHVENAESGVLNDSARDSLKEIAKITGAYKQQSIQGTVNVFNLSLPEGQEAKFKEFFDTVAIEQPGAAA